MALAAEIYDALTIASMSAHTQTMQHAANGAQRQADGASMASEVLRMNSVGQLATADARAGRVTDESGSGRARDLAKAGT